MVLQYQLLELALLTNSNKSTNCNYIEAFQ